MSDAKGRYFLIILLGVLFFTPKGWPLERIGISRSAV